MANVPCAPSGEIDRSTVDRFRDDLYEIIDECDAPIVRIDLRAVTFMDSAGYRALIDANEHAIRRGHTMSIRNLDPQCAKLIGLCDRDNELHIEGLAPASN
jgi:anti-anti-sigma factor